MSSGTLLVIGAGPKALAIHLRAAVLRELGRKSPQVVIIEKSRVGANWRGSDGFTDGTPPLVTPPEWDVGFPYASGDPKVDLMTSRFSWHTYMIAERKLGNWLARGRTMPLHSEFADYLEWVASSSDLRMIPGRVPSGGIRRDGHDWLVNYHPTDGSPLTIRAGSIVVTGPGSPMHLVDGQDSHPNISDSETFWHRIGGPSFTDLKAGRIAVVGSGDTAASVVCSLLETLPTNSVAIDVFCTKGMLVSRHERPWDLRLWMDPTAWADTPPRGRFDYVWRTQRGVCSEVFMSRIVEARNVSIRPGMIREARMSDKLVRITIQDHNKHRSKEEYKRLIVATGFRRWAFQDMFEAQAMFPYQEPSRDGWEKLKERKMAEKVGTDLRYGLRFKRPKLFAPPLSGMACGPGFANLGSLGTMAERIINAHLSTGLLASSGSSPALLEGRA